jgi:hypothetical protein
MKHHYKFSSLLWLWLFFVTSCGPSRFISQTEKAQMISSLHKELHPAWGTEQTQLALKRAIWRQEEGLKCAISPLYQALHHRRLTHDAFSSIVQNERVSLRPMLVAPTSSWQREWDQRLGAWVDASLGYLQSLPINVDRWVEGWPWDEERELLRSVFIAVDHHMLLMGESDPSSALMRIVRLLDRIYDRLPVIVPVMDSVQTSPFGMRLHPVSKTMRLHEGIDLVGDNESPIIATAYGVVRQSNNAGSYGNLIIVDHGAGMETRYAHLDERESSTGDEVAPGTLIGTQGQSGKVTGEHLHYEIRFDGKAIDPWPFIYSCRKQR